MRDNLQNITDMLEIDAKLELKITDKSTIETGGRLHYRHIARNIIYDNFSNDQWEHNSKLSDCFNLNGNSYAAYLIFSSSLGDFSYSAGLRAQADQLKHDSYKLSQKVKRNYFNLFPTISVGYAFGSDKNNTVNITYSRGISYIPYSEISPAVKYIDEYSYTRGNPDLIPSLDNMLMLSATLQKWSFWYDYYHTVDDIHYVTLLDEGNPLIKYSMPFNAGKSDYHMAGISKKIAISRWWDMYINGSMRNKTIHYTESDIKKQYSSTAFFGGINNTFSWNENWSGFLNLYAETREKIDDKIMMPVYNLSIGLGRYLCNRKILLRVNSQPVISKLRQSKIDKAFYWSYNRLTTNQTNIFFSVTYNFKSGSAVNVTRARKIQSIEEKLEKK